MEGIDVIFHQGAYGGYMPEIAKYVHVNSFGTAQMLEVIREDNLPIKKIVVASSQAVYSEGAATCPTHGLVFPGRAPRRATAHGRLDRALPAVRRGRRPPRRRPRKRPSAARRSTG